MGIIRDFPDNRQIHPTVPKFYRHCESFPSAAIRQSDFGNLAVFGSPFGPVFHHPDTPLPGLDVYPWNVRLWLLADIQPHPDLRPLYPRKQTFPAVMS